MLALLALLACTDPALPGCPEQAWFTDGDADGFGAGEPTLACAAPRGTSALGTDCDDTRADVWPGAAEACTDDVDRDCDGVTPVIDVDGDGWVACVDCDDADPTRSPDALEFCDGVDDDCDGAVDEGAVDARVWYADVDGDGFGDAAAEEEACELRSGWVANSLDCDDADAGRSPEATEACNDVDDDCDGGTDEPEDFPEWYPDVDGDGYGDTTRGERTCRPDDGWTLVAGDCDDVSALVSPGVSETCNAVDDDCDHDVDEDAVDATLWFEDQDGDGWGDPTSARLGCDVVATWVPTGDDCDDTDVYVFPGAGETCNTIDDDCDGASDEADALDADLWFTDADGDGAAGVAVYVRACVAPAGTYAAALDCDDADPAIGPTVAETCDGVDQDCDGVVDEAAADATAWYTDADGDGYGGGLATLACAAPAAMVADGSDCDDGAADVHPGADEVCDSLDRDCDGSVDAGAADAEMWYLDRDADGFGAGVGTVACDAPSGTVANTDDCDDADATVHPGAEEDCLGADANCDGRTGFDDGDGDGWGACFDCDDADPARAPGAVEQCDGVDGDCDGVVDEDAEDAVLVWSDLDADGFGDPGAASWVCEVGAGLVFDATDCVDTDEDAHPGALERCGSAADDDCDGSDNDVDAVDCARFYLDFDEDGSGSTSHACMCVAAAPYTAADADDCDDGDPAVSPLTVEIWGNRVDDDCDDEVDVVSVALAAAVYEGGRALDGAGASLAGPGDVNGDGLADLLVGAPDQDSGGVNAGAAYLVLGGGVGIAALADSEAILLGDESGDDAGRALAGKDLDGDGYSDILVGAPEHDSSAGVAYVLFGPVTGTSSLADADVVVPGEGAGDEAGAVLATGDVDGDGRGDLLVGGDGDDDGGSGAGAVWVIADPAAGASMSAADAKFVGEDAGDQAGTAVASGADVDGDGIDDLLIGAPGDDDSAADAGAVYLLLGPLAGTVDLLDNDGKYVGEYSGDEVGLVARFVRDMDDDGVDELLLASSGYGSGGAAWLHRGPGSDVHHRTNEAVATWTGDTFDDDLGYSAAGIGDVNGDGWNDLAFGAPGLDEEGSGSGGVLLWFGPVIGSFGSADADSSLYGDSSGDAAGVALAALGDTDGDGVPDLAVGGTGEDGGASNAGAAWLFDGPGG